MEKNNLSKIIRAMQNPEIYPHAVKDIKFVQTQMSCVFLTGKHVYKIKKPVNFGFLDYTTLEKRKNFCEREVVLNRRLSPEVYVEVVPIILYQGKIFLGEGIGGEVVEYAVKMKQLPAERMLSSFLGKNRATKTLIKKIVQKLVVFHREAETNQEIAVFGGLETIQGNCRENFEQTEKYIDSTIPAKAYQKIKSWTENFIAENRSLFQKRIGDGKIRDCHGDLQSDHICLWGRKIYIYDCIEFNERFRYGDVASEVAFLAMDLDFHGYPDLSDYFVHYYVEKTKDYDLLELIDFYKCYRAYVLGKVRSFKSDDKLVPEGEREKAREIARKYFKLACSYVCQKPTLVVICGLSGSGKTTTAKILVEKTGFQYISSDIVRKKLTGIPLFAHKYHEFGKGIYAPEFSRKAYEKMFEMAKGFLENGKSVIIDATFKKREERQRVMDLAKKLGIKFLFVECRRPEKFIKKRLEKRAKEKAVSDADWKIYIKQKKDFDKITEIPPQNHLIIDTSNLSDQKIIQKIKEKISENQRQEI